MRFWTIVAREGGVYLAWGGSLEDNNPQPKAACGLLQFGWLARRFRIVRVEKQGNNLGIGDQIVQQRQPLLYELGTEPSHPGDVAARLVEACDKAVFARVVVAREDNWDCTGRRLGCDRRILATGGNDHGHLTSNEIGR